MNKKAVLPKVTLIGRTNVGKSTLFNRLSTDVKSITLDYEGVTRDFVSDIVCWQDVCFELIDSGGISLKRRQEELDEAVRMLVLQLVTTTELVLFVVDGKVGPTVEDTQIASYLRRQDKDVILIVNKIDNVQSEQQMYEFAQLGFSTMLPISAQHGIGIDRVLEAIVHYVSAIPVTYVEPTVQYNVVLLGKPNVGKSSLMNLLLSRERALVSAEPGTTREAITEPLRFYQETILVTDTPGIRRKRTVDEPLEKLMVQSSFTAVKSADIVLLLVDGSQGVMSDQELKLAFYALEQYKALIILVNKSDLMTEEMREEFENHLLQYKHLVKKVVILHISCKTGKNIGKIVPFVHEVWQRYSQRIPADELSSALLTAMIKKPLYHKSQLLKLLQAKQVKTAPITIVLFVNHPAWFGPSQIGFLENILRKRFDLEGVPVRFLPRKV